MEDSDDDEPPMLVALAEDGVPSTTTGGSAPTPVVQQDQFLPKEDLHDLPPCPVTILSGFLGTNKVLPF